MWIIEPQENLSQKESNIFGLNLLWNRDNVFIMDNHLAAGWVWMNHLNKDESYNFFHVDRHEDLCGGLARQERLQEIISELPFTIQQYTEYTFDNGISTPQPPFNKVFSWDTYIKQTQYSFPNWFQKSYFACRGHVDDPPRYTRLPLNIIYCPEPFELYNNVEHWVVRLNNECKWIFNLDLDYFFDGKGMRIFSDEYILTFAEDVKKSMGNIAILTIAMSPECCGSWQNALSVLALFDRVFGFEDVIDTIVQRL